MAELNSSDHLVHLDKDTIVNGYDNEGYHPHTDEGDDPPGSDDERLRSTNGHCVDAAQLSNGHVATPTPVNGSVVVDVDDANMDVKSDVKDSHRNKPLDTRLHHYVPVEDVDRKILNGSERCSLPIPDDAVVDVSGRVRVRKSASNSPRPARGESIALEDMRPPSYDGDDAKSEKAELEAELSNHKNGVWSSGEGLNAYGESHFISEKLNGKSTKSGGDESGKLPVNNHRKCLRGEKLYFTEESRKICPNFKKGVICGIVVVVISVVLLLCVLAATGIILSKSENTRYESGHSLPSMDSISHAGHSFRPRPPPKVPHQFLNTTVTQTPTVTSRVPLPDDSSHTQTTVPNALVGEFTIIDENFTDDLNDNSSRGYINLARNLETELRRIFRENGGKFDSLKILNFRPGSIKVKFVVIWSSGEGVILSDRATEILSADLKQKNNSFYNFFPVDIDSIQFVNVFDECRTQKGGCSFDCVWNYDTLSKTCICSEDMYLLPDGKSCALIPETSSASTTTSTATPAKPGPIPPLPTFTIEETTFQEIENLAQGNGSAFVSVTEELVSTQSSFGESTTIINKEVTDSESALIIENNEQMSPETTTVQPMFDKINTETPPTHLIHSTENHVVWNAETSTNIANENQTVRLPTEISVITDTPATTYGKINSIPVFEDSTTEEIPHTVATENRETTIFNTEIAYQPLPSTTMEMMEETGTPPPLLETTSEDTSLKFHVIEPTTEVYTFNSNFDYITENLDRTIAPDTLPSKENVTEFPGLPLETIYPITFNENITQQPEMQLSNATEFESFTTTNPPWTYSEVNREGTLKEDKTDITTVNANMGIDQTQPTITDLEISHETTTSTFEISDIDHSTLPSILSKNETEEEFTTGNPEVLPTTSSFIPFSNRTAGVRYIDNFTDLYENITDNRYFTDVTSTEAVTEETYYVSEFPLSVDNSSITDATTSYPTTETTPEKDFMDTTAENRPTVESIWIKKVDKVTDSPTQSNNLTATETAMEAETALMNFTSFEMENATFSFETSTNVEFSLEDEVHLEHKNDTLILPMYNEEPETTTTGLDIETATSSFPTVLESLVTIPEIIPQNSTEDVTINTTSPSNESMFFAKTESTTLLPYSEVNTNVQEIANKSEMTSNYSEIPTITTSYSLEDTTELSTFESITLTYPDLQNVTDNPFMIESNLTDTAFSDTGTTLILPDIEISNISSGMELDTTSQATLQYTTLPIELNDTDIIPMESANATVILDSDFSTHYPDETLTLTNEFVPMTEVSTEAVLYTDSTNYNESTDFFINDNFTQTAPSAVVVTDTLNNSNASDLDTEFSVMNGTEVYVTTFVAETKSPVELTNETDSLTNHTLGMETNETITYTPFIFNFTEEVTTLEAETSLVDGNVSDDTSTTPYIEITTAMPNSFKTESLSMDDKNATEFNPILFNGTDTFLDTEEGTTFAPYLTENTTTVEENSTEPHYNWRNVANKQDENLTGDFGFLSEHFNATDGNYSFDEDDGNYTSTGFEGLLNETTTNASVGIVCREDQFICEPLNTCLNYTFMCDGIQDCPDGVDEFSCQDSCGSNFRCSNSSNMCIMSQAHCDGIWDCENGTDEDNCAPTECAKHEVMCLDHSKCIRPSDICDLKYDCKDRSDEVGCVERTTCESGGRFFCNDGLCIPWSLKCDGEFDCKDKEDEGNCTCLSDEFQCNDGKCLKSSSRCDGHKDCHDADDEMGCVNVDSQHIVTTYEPYSGTWALLCAEDFNLDDGHYLCQELGFGHALITEKLHVSFNGTWMAMRRENLTDASLWTERVSFVESCTSSSAAVVECQKFACGEYSGLLHRRKRDVLSSSSSSTTQWPFIGYTSTFNSNRGCMSEILTPIWLITSAECLLSINKEPYNGSDWYVRTNIGRGGDAGLAQNHEVLRIVSHPHSSKFRSLILRDYDVALVRLKHALVFVSDKIGAICPPEEQVPPGITCFSGVLGTQKPRAPPPTELTINSLALQIMERKNCNSVEHYNNQINQRMLCTQSSEGHTICDNDEGTPLMCLSGINNWFLAGMLTYQRYCEVYSKHPAVFSNLYAMRKFIDQVTGQKQYEISYDPNVYMIIPPTTPSPTVPETTTFLYTSTEAFTTELATDFNYTMTSMFNESETDTTQEPEMSLYPMLQDGNVTEPFEGRIEEDSTLETVEMEGEALFTTTPSMVFTMESNVTENATRSMDGNGTLGDASVYPDWNTTSNMTRDFDVDNFTTLEPLTLQPDVNATISTMLNDNSTLEEEFGFENVSNVEPEMYEKGLFNMSGMPNKTHDSMMIGLTTETYPAYDNATEDGLLNATSQTMADDKVTTVTLLEETDIPLVFENTTDLDFFNSTMMQAGKDQVESLSNETSFKAPERLTLTTLHPAFDGETTPSVMGMDPSVMNTTDFPIVNETMSTDYNFTGIDESEVKMGATTDAVMKAARFEAETIGVTDPSILINETTTLSFDFINATKESETQSTEPTEYPFLWNDNESVVENMTAHSDAFVIGLTEKPFLVKEDHIPETNFEEEERMRLTENPYFDNETITAYPDFKNTTENNDDSNSTTETATVLETTEYTADMASNPDLMLTTMVTDVGTSAFEAEVETGGDLSITLNGSDGIVVKHVASPDIFGNFDEANTSREYLARSRMLDDSGNSSGILFDSGLLNSSFPNDSVVDAGTPSDVFGNIDETNNSTLDRGLVLVDSGNSSGRIFDSGLLNSSFPNVIPKDFIVDAVTPSDVFGNIDETNNSTSAQGMVLVDSGNSSGMIFDSGLLNSSFPSVIPKDSIVDAVTPADVFGNIDETNNSTLVRGMVLDDAGNSSRNSEYMNKSFQSIGLNNSDGILSENVSSSNILGNFEDYNSTFSNSSLFDDATYSSGTEELVGTENLDTVNLDSSFSVVKFNDSDAFLIEPVTSPSAFGNYSETNNSTAVRNMMLEEGSNSSGIIYDWKLSNNSFPDRTSLPINKPIIKIDLDTAMLLDNVTLLGNVTESENATLPIELTVTLPTALVYEMDSNDTAQNEAFVTEFTTPLIEYENSMLNETMTNVHVTASKLEIFDYEYCGRWGHPSNVSDTKPIYAKWPSLGYLKMENQLCTSSLISSRFVITSLKCLSLRDSETKANKWSYVGGIYNTDPSIFDQQNHLVQEIITFPNISYAPFNNDDLALVKLWNRVNLDEYSTNVCLPKVRNSTLQECYTTGWKNDSSGNPDIFSVPVDVISQEECNNTNNYNGLLAHNFICASSKASLLTCEMDPGAPLYCLNSEQKWEIQGILTIPNSCDMKQPAVFTGISSAIDWIAQNFSRD